ncbi:MAG: hypothetical protein ACYTG7_13550 [Planctomycetota bacterium]|jgi:hypothetical protein
MAQERKIKLGTHIDVVPSIHQRSVFAAEVRKKFLEQRYSAVAVELPPFLKDTVVEGVKRLPMISMAVHDYTFPDGDTRYAYVPLDPCDSIIEAVRMAVPERIPIHAVDLDSPLFQNLTTVLPDEYAARRCSLADYYDAVRMFLPPTPKDSIDALREQWMAARLRALHEKGKSVLFVCGLGHLAGIKKHFYGEVQAETVEPPDIYAGEPRLYSVNPDTLAFLLGELPYLTFLYERARASIDGTLYEETDGIRELLVAARDEFRSEDAQQADTISPARLQLMIRYIRNLCLIKKRLTPYLFEIVQAAKGVGGSQFAIQVVQLAKYYPFLDTEMDLLSCDMGINQGRLADLGSQDLSNRLPGPPVEWKTVKLRRPPLPKMKQNWAFLWNPFKACSWPPEDDKIESFHRHVRDLTRRILSEDQAKVEKFTTSVKDGIDLRESIRNWHKNEIYVKEQPPARGKVEVVVFIFDEGEDRSQYPWRTTWYAEHTEESTLALYATDYLTDMVGPGIARAQYGGCFLLYPPRPIPDIWQDPRLKKCRTLAEQLTLAAMLHTRERFVTYVGPRRPGLRLREAARRLGRHLVFIPLSSFSQQTIQRLRLVHVLNGMEIRSWAAHFIRDPWQL